MNTITIDDLYASAWESAIRNVGEVLGMDGIHKPPTTDIFHSERHGEKSVFHRTPTLHNYNRYDINTFFEKGQ